MLLLFLALSLVGFSIGPLLVAWGRGRALPSAAVDGFTLGVVPSLILLHVVPHMVEEVGVGALGLLGAGYGVVWLADRRAHDGGRIGSVVVLPALVVHALGDGAALALATASGGDHGGERVGAGLSVALVLHRLSEGLFLATSLVPVYGWRRALPRMGAVAGATVVGALLGRALLARVPDAVFEAVAAFGIGAMLRLAVHSHQSPPTEPRPRAAGALGFLAGVTLALWVPDPDSVLQHARAHELAFVDSLGPLFVETAPSMLLGLLAAGAAQTFLPRPVAGWLAAPSTLAQAARGVVFGVPLPLCTCGVLPLVRRLLAAGVPVAAVAAFAIGTPALDLGGVVFTFRLLGAPLAATRVAAGVVVAVVTALVVSAATRGVSMRVSLRPAPRRSMLQPQARWSATPHEPSPGDAAAGHAIARTLRQALGPTLDHVAAWYVVGLCAAAALEAALDPRLVARLGAPWDVGAAAILAVPAYVCALGATPFAAVLMHKGASLGAGVVFLVVGPGTNLPVLAALGRALGRRAAAAFALASLGTAVALGVAANAIIPASSLPDMHGLAAHRHSAWEIACAALLAALLARSLLRMGPRPWFGAMAHGDERADDDGHDH
ncbi:MAG: permease [Polyangiales bacterium]